MSDRGRAQDEPPPTPQSGIDQRVSVEHLPRAEAMRTEKDHRNAQVETIAEMIGDASITTNMVLSDGADLFGEFSTRVMYMDKALAQIALRDGIDPYRDRSPGSPFHGEGCGRAAPVRCQRCNGLLSIECE